METRFMTRTRYAAYLSAVLAFCFVTGLAAAQTVERVSVNSAETQGNGDSHSSYYSDPPSISRDGRFVAFESRATNLVLGDTNGSNDIFVRDRLAGTTERISVSSGEAQGNGNSYRPSISRDGRFVAFESLASNLVADDTNQSTDVFVRDRLNGSTERVSLTNAGAQARYGGQNPSVSADGRLVAFVSPSLLTGVGDAYGVSHIYVRDRVGHTTELISLRGAGVKGNSDSDEPSISGNGRFVAFQSYATNLVPSDTNAHWDIFVRDRVALTTERVSVSSAEAQANNSSVMPGISYDGRFVAFTSYASALVAGDSGDGLDSFLRDRALGATGRTSANSPLANTGAYGTSTAVSDNGRAVVFDSYSSFNTPESNGASDVFVNDRVIGIVDWISTNSAATAEGGGNAPTISADGRFVAFVSSADDLVPGDTNYRTDVFVRDRGPQSVRRRDLSILFREQNVWQWMNGSAWVKVLNYYATSPIPMAVGRLDSNLSDEAIIGRYIGNRIIARYNNATWVSQREAAPTLSLAAGDLNGDGFDDIVASLANSRGLWAGYSRTNWVKLHSKAPESIAAGDLDGNGKDEVIADFGATGIWAYFNNSTWTRLHTQSPLRVVTGDLDGNGKAEVIGDFNALGIWVRMDNGAWKKLHNSTSSGLAIGDLNGNGKDDVLVAFISGGFWVRYDDGAWQRLHSSSPTHMAAADVDGNGKDDVVADFNAGWIWRRRDTGVWEQIRQGNSLGIVAGDFD
jgi:hypothetical protein